MKSLEVFRDDVFMVRTVEIDSEPWFSAKDVCDCLGIENSSQAISRLDDDERGVIRPDGDGVISNDPTEGPNDPISSPNDRTSLEILDNLGRAQPIAVINESGLYSLILTSRKEEAKIFKRWITHDVLPAIRKTGEYSVNDKYEEPELRVVTDAERNALTNMARSTHNAKDIKKLTKALNMILVEIQRSEARIKRFRKEMNEYFGNSRKMQTVTTKTREILPKPQKRAWDD